MELCLGVLAEMERKGIHPLDDQHWMNPEDKQAVCVPFVKMLCQALSDERERCAEIAQNNRFGWHTEYESFAKEKGDGIARDIREGG